MTSVQLPAASRITPLDIGIVGAGVAAFVFSFFGYYTASVSGAPRSTGAWHGFFGWFAAVLALLGALALAAAFLLPGRAFRAPPYRVVLVFFAAATVSVLAALSTAGFDTSRAEALRVAADTGHGYGYWISLAAIVAGAALSLGRVLHAGGRLSRPGRKISILGGTDQDG